MSLSIIQIDKFAHGFLLQDSLSLKKEELLSFISDCEKSIEFYKDRTNSGNAVEIFTRDIERFKKDVVQIDYLIECLNP